MRSLRRSNSGLTLIELLVVIAIIALLATLLFSVMSSVRGQAQAAECLTNLRRIGIGLHAYSTDHQGRLAPKVASPQRWPTPVDTYMGGKPTTGNVSSPVWACPTNNPKAYKKLKTGQKVQASEVGWCINQVLDDYSVQTAAVRMPGSMVYVIEINLASFKGGPQTEVNMTKMNQKENPDNPDTWKKYRGHQGGCSVLFVDGHVEKAKPPPAEPYHPLFDSNATIARYYWSHLAQNDN